jgi:hypothetical protein
MQNDATTSISKADMQKVIQLSGHESEIIDFSKIASETTAAAPNKEDGAKKPV